MFSCIFCCSLQLNGELQNLVRIVGIYSTVLIRFKATLLNNYEAMQRSPLLEIE